jgi:bifunctional non-homologous end joining protein LigD
VDSPGLAAPQWQTTPTADDGAALLAATAAHGLEGVVAKHRASQYRPGRRSVEWIKAKHWREEELDVLALPSRRDGRRALEVGRPGPDGPVFSGVVELGLAAHATLSPGSRVVVRHHQARPHGLLRDAHVLRATE